MSELYKKQTNKTQYVKMSEAFCEIYLHHLAFYEKLFVLQKASLILTYRVLFVHILYAPNFIMELTMDL